MESNYDDRQILVTGKLAGEKIKNTSILVVGAGAAGNEILKNLALMGFGHFTIVDFDIIEKSNLSRTTLFRKEDNGQPKALVAAERLKELVLHESPEIKGVYGNVITDFGKGEFLKHDIVICCVDTMKARAWLNDWCVAFGKPFFEIGFREFNSDVTFVHYENEDSPCLRSLIGYGNFDEKRNSCSGLIIKDEELDHIPTIQSTSAVAAGMLVTEIIKFIKGESVLKGKTLKYNGNSYNIDIYHLKRTENKKPIVAPGQKIHKIPFGNDAIIIDVLKEMNKKFEDYFILKLPDVFVESWECRTCKRKAFPRKRKSIIHDDEMQFKECGKQATPDHCRGSGNWINLTELHLNSEEYFLTKSLSYFGIPSRDILTLQGVKGKNRIIINVMLN